MRRVHELGSAAGLGHMRAKEAKEDPKTGTIRVANAVSVCRGGESADKTQMSSHLIFHISRPDVGGILFIRLFWSMRSPIERG